MGVRGPCAVNPIEMTSRVLTRKRVPLRIAVGAISFVALAALAFAALAAPGAAGAEKIVKVKVVNESGKPFLGINMQELDAAILKGLDPSVKKGVLVTQVVDGSPADEAGIEDGDIVILFDRNEVGSPSELKALVDAARVGDTVGVRLVRDGEPRAVKVTIGDWPDDESAAVVAPEAFRWLGEGKGLFDLSSGRGRLGVQVAELNEGLAPYFGVEQGRGVLVLDVVDGSTAAKMGIKAGDVIKNVGGEKVGSVEDLVGAVGELETGKKFDLGLVRAKKDMILQGEAEENPVDVYVKALGRGKDGRAPGIEKFYMHHDLQDLPHVDVEQMKKDMDQMKIELEKVRQELEKIKDSA